MAVAHLRRRPLARLMIAAAAVLSFACWALSGVEDAFVNAASQVRSPALAMQGTAVETPPATDTAKPESAKPKPKPKPKRKPLKPKPKVPVMDQLTTGILAPAVVAGYAIFGEPFIAKLRGKGIGLHSQAITAYCERFGIASRKRQGFIKTAKKTGHDLGFLVPGGHWGDGLIGEAAMEWYKNSGIDRWDVSNW